MLEQHLSEVPTLPSPCEEERIRQGTQELRSACFRAITLFVSSCSSLTGQSLIPSLEVQRLPQRIIFSPSSFRAVPKDQALEYRYTTLEEEVYSRLPSWQR